MITIESEILYLNVFFVKITWINFFTDEFDNKNDESSLYGQEQLYPVI